ncbi:MAG: FKBP-type peptidyl-prolyl cis-trans isomerase [Eggerthellaceae bacterium]|nr:FKBP-type peptidyl-prolyl cis-trans isomerase [Eggerthellaceae bacterium]
MKPQNGDTVLVRHRVTTLEGDEIESSFDKRYPFRFTVGSGRVIKGMNDAVCGLDVGESTKAVVPAALAHGEYDARKYRPVRKTAFFKEVKVGQNLTFQGELGEPVQAVVLREEGDLLFLDTNHPLAGKDLVLEIELLEILEDGTQEPFI